MKYLKKMSGYLVYLSPVNPEDFEISAKWMNDREVAENLSSRRPSGLRKTMS